LPDGLPPLELPPPDPEELPPPLPPPPPPQAARKSVKKTSAIQLRMWRGTMGHFSFDVPDSFCMERQFRMDVKASQVVSNIDSGGILGAVCNANNTKKRMDG